jgi:DNA-binding MarR family transcriptional regulator
LVKRELERLKIYDVNSAQCVLLHNIGEVELTIGEVTSRGYHVGSNVTYNVKKLAENGYLVQKRSAHDRRSIHVQLTHRGYALRDRIGEMFGMHTEILNCRTIPEADLQGTADTLRRLEQFWMYAGSPAENREGAAVCDHRMKRGRLDEAARSFSESRRQKNHRGDDTKMLQTEHVAGLTRHSRE